MAMTPIPERQAQALREVGRTEITPAIAILLTLAFLATVSAVPVLQAITDLRDANDPSLWPRLRPLVAAGPKAVETARKTGLLSANRRLQGAVDHFETRVEEESVLRGWILPATQRVLTYVLGVGNEQAYLGRDSWLFYREDFEHVTGRGFLDASVLRNANLAGGRAANPLPAILALQRQLRKRDIKLLIVPTPVKPTIHPEYLRSRADPLLSSAPIHNPSYGEFLHRLEAAGIPVLDPSVTLAAAKLAQQETAEPLFLRADTHWTPAAMGLVAGALADRVNELADWDDWNEPPTQFRRRSVSVEGTGDTAAMLKLPDGAESFPPERIQLSLVVTREGRSWKPSPEAEILVLGDSFTNVYSDAGLGWGSGAGLAEQLSFHLGRPVDRIAVNAGGALSSRQALLRALQSDPRRLDSTRIVIYQFSSRELSGGDWQTLPLPESP